MAANLYPRRLQRARALAFLLALLLLVPAASAQQLDTTRLAGMKARSIGPAGMSGRVTAFDVVLRRPEVIYAGTASGGLWKSTSGGIDWKPIFDDQPVASIGAVAVFQKNPDVVWVGTGEGNPRNSQTNGNGVYKSLDGGRTWTHLGLDDSRNIHRLLLHPDDPDVAYVGAQGPAWGETSERGVFKTTDGGRTWRKILYVDEKTGVGDLVMDPSNPDKLFAAMWEFRRWPWFFDSGGEGSGLYVSVDGGETWTERTHEDGLPEGELGRIGVAVARSRPEVVYALVEAKKNALYRSDDGGVSFRKVNDKEEVSDRPFYYNDLFVDPANENRVYHVSSLVSVSEDGGKSFETLIPFSRVHPDHHAWWIHPEDPDFLLDGNDGGMAISHDRGRTWRFVENLPLAQFYHINVDLDVPYHVYGGMQDNGSWRGPAYAWRQGGIRNAYWEEVAFGDGFDVVPDPSDPRYGYAMWQGGNLQRYDLATGHSDYIKPVHPDGQPLRFNWNAALAADPFDPETIYYGSQFVHKSTDRGESWTIISPDLTTNDPEKQRQLESGGLTYDVTNAENFTTIVALAPSPLEPGVLWAGTDDGHVQLTRDGGATWTNVVGNIRGVPEGTWVPQIRASKHDPAEAFVVFDDHRRNNWEPYLYRTRDYGRTWTRLAGDVWGYALSVEQDPIAPNLLFLGTEFGLYVSIDDGAHWTRWTHGYPTVSTMDLVIHPREHDLVVGTFGRSAYVLDDIRPLRALAQEGARLLEAPLHVFDPPPAYLAAYKQAAGTRFAAEAHFAGENRPYGATITYVVNPPEEAEDDSTSGGEKDKVTLSVVDASGAVIRTFEGPAKAGLNRATWGLDRRGVRFPGSAEPKPDAPEPGGPAVLPGTYTVRIAYGDRTDSTVVAVRPDPRLALDEAALRERGAMVDRWMRLVATATEAADRLRAAKDAAGAVGERLAGRDEEEMKELKDRGKAVQDSIQALVERFTGEEVQGIRRDPETVNARLSTASSYLQAGYDVPGAGERLAYDQAEAAVRDALADVNRFFAEDWAAYRAAVEAAGVSFFDDYEPLRVE